MQKMRQASETSLGDGFGRVGGSAAPLCPCRGSPALADQFTCHSSRTVCTVELLVAGFVCLTTIKSSATAASQHCLLQVCILLRNGTFMTRKSNTNQMQHMPDCTDSLTDLLMAMALISLFALLAAHQTAYSMHSVGMKAPASSAAWSWRMPSVRLDIHGTRPALSSLLRCPF